MELFVGKRKHRVLNKHMVIEEDPSPPCFHCLLRLGADERLLMKGKRANHVLQGMRVFSTNRIQTNTSHKTSLNTRPVSLLLSFMKGDDWF